MATMAALKAVLPSQHRGEVQSEVLAEAYWRMLGHYPADAIRYLEAEALKRCKWFPTIAECIEILRGFTVRHPLAAKRDQVLRRVSAEHEARFDEAMVRLVTDDPPAEWIDALPASWKRIAETRGFLRVHPDGTYTTANTIARELAARRVQSGRLV